MIEQNISNIDTFFSQSGDFLNILGMIGIALLTILIPIALAIFNNDSDDFKVLDRNVILDHVVGGQFFIVYLTLIFFPLFLWTSLPISKRFWALFVWAIGILLLSKVLVSSYYWMKGKKFPLRFDYLKNLTHKQDMEESWRSVWETKNINAQNEREFFLIYSAAIDNLLKNDDRKS